MRSASSETRNSGYAAFCLPLLIHGRQQETQNMARLQKAGTLFSMAVLVALVLTTCGDTNSIEEHFEKGNEYAQAGEFDKAVTEFEAVLQEDSKNVSAMSNLGVGYYNLGRLDEAIEQYQKAVELAPEDADIHSNLAAAFVQKGQLDKALEQYQTAVTLNPELAEAHYGLGVVYRQIGKIDEAIGAFESFQELDTGTDPMASDLAKQFLEQLRGQ
jgi:Flp pilus assembly protein TadD